MRVVCASILALLLVAMPICAVADELTRIVVPYGPGPGLDAVGRILAKQLAVVQEHGVIVENRPGANTAIGTEHVHNSKADGKTLLLNGSALSVGASRKVFAFDPQEGLKAVIQVSDADSFLVVHSGLPVASLDDLLARSKVARLNCAAVAGQYEFACNLLQALLGTDVATVLYKGVGEATTAVMSGEVDLMFASRAMLSPMFPTGKVRVIAAATQSAAQSPFNAVPLLKDRWPGFVLSGMVGIFAPRDTPQATIEELNSQFRQVLSDPEVKESFAALGVIPAGGSAADLSRRLAGDVRFFAGATGGSKAAKP